MSLSPETPHKPAPNRRRACMRWGCISIIILLVILAAGIMYYRHMLYGRLTPDQIAWARQAETDILVLPDDWHRPATLPSPEALAFWDEFLAKTHNLLDEHKALLYEPDYKALLAEPGYNGTTTSLFDQMGDGGPVVHDDQRASYTVLLADLKPIIELTSASVDMPDFTMEVDTHTTQTTWFFDQNFAKLMSIAARDEAAQGHYMLAMDYAALPMRMVKRTEQASLINHLISVAVGAICTNALDKIASQCTDVAALTRGADYLKELRSTVFPGNTRLWRYSDSVGALRRAAANGYPADLSTQTLASYYKQSGWIYQPRYFQWIIDNLPAEDRRVAPAKMWLELSNKTIDNSLAHRLGNVDFITDNPILYAAARKLLGIDTWMLNVVIMGSNLDGQLARTDVIMTMYDLTQMHFARRIAELKGEPIPAPLADPFSTGTLQFSAERNAYYSIGPDKVDQKAAVWYDATNGTVSSGDVLVGRERNP